MVHAEAEAHNTSITKQHTHPVQIHEREMPLTKHRQQHHPLYICIPMHFALILCCIRCGLMKLQLPLFIHITLDECEWEWHHSNIESLFYYISPRFFFCYLCYSCVHLGWLGPALAYVYLLWCWENRCESNRELNGKNDVRMLIRLCQSRRRMPLFFF